MGALGASLEPGGVPAPNGVGGGIVGVLTAAQAADVLKSLERAKGMDLLSTPCVTTRSGQQAVVETAREFRCPTEYDRDQKTGQWVSKAFETVAEALKQLAGLAGMQLEVGPSAFVLRPAADQE